MYAALLRSLGNNSTLAFEEVETPTPQSGEALVKVLYCGVNHLDLLIRQGKRPWANKFPHILGSEMAGEIVKTTNESSFKNRDVAVVYPWTFCGTCEQCLSGREQLCDRGGTLGRTRWGGYAEYAVVPIQNLVKIPQGLQLDRVCASVLSSITAYHMIDRAKIPDGATVLITGATGGVGTSAIQLLKHKKCTLICATSSKQKGARLRDLGVNHVISPDLKNELPPLAPAGVQFAIDIMGGSVWSDVIDVLGKNGTVVFCSTTLPDPASISVGGAMSKQLNILGSYGGSRNDLKEVLKLLEKGILNPVIDSTLPLKDANIALEKIESKDVFGKILLKPQRPFYP